MALSVFRPSAASIAYGQKLSEVVLSGGVASVPGAFSVSNSSLSPSVGTAILEILFVPADSGNYSSFTQNVTIDVTKALPIIAAWPASLELAPGQSLSDITLAGGESSIAGAFRFVDGTSLPAVGTAEIAVEFVPDDSLQYASLVGSIQVNVHSQITDRVVSLDAIQPTLRMEWASGGGLQ